MAKTKITIERLAAMIKRGFDQTTTKPELAELKNEVGGLKNEVGGLKNEVGGIKNEVGGLKREMAILRDELERQGADIHDIKITLGLMTRAVASQEAEIKNLQHRMARIEKKVGLTR